MSTAATATTPSERLTAREFRCPSCGAFLGSSTATFGWGKFKCPSRRCGKWIFVSFAEPDRRAC